MKLLFQSASGPGALPPLSVSAPGALCVGFWRSLGALCVRARRTLSGPASPALSVSDLGALCVALSVPLARSLCLAVPGPPQCRSACHSDPLATHPACHPSGPSRCSVSGPLYQGLALSVSGPPSGSAFSVSGLSASLCRARG